MYFGELDLDDALGCYLAHSIKLPQRRLRKGLKLTAELLEELRSNDIKQVTVARLDKDDVHEDHAASVLASKLHGKNVHCGEARTGRVNLYASRTGLLALSREDILACNSVDNNITIATLPENMWVQAGRMVATVKIISYAVTEQSLQQAVSKLATNGETLAIHEPQTQRAHLIQTRLTGTSDALLEKTEKITRNRLISRDIELASSSVCEHSERSLSTTIKDLRAAEHCSANDWLLIIGASAISDIGDVVPTVARQLGGNIRRFGIPVDPGNLLLLADIDKHPLIGLPGCARSPKANGLDQFIDRMACKLPIDDSWINSLAVGGLLGEVFERPQPRTLADRQYREQNGSQLQGPLPSITAVVLAAGSSTRFGEENKLLADWQGEAMIIATLNNLLESEVNNVLLISGSDAKALLQVLACRFESTSSTQQNSSTSTAFHCRIHNKKIQVIHNPLHASGMGSSLKTAISSLLSSSQIDKHSETPVPSVLICLGDMPVVKPDTINRLIQAANRQVTEPGTMRYSAFLPSFKGKRGNPVLLNADLFDDLLAIDGDRGARDLLSGNPDIVQLIPVDDAGILLDIDTPTELDTQQGAP